MAQKRTPTRAARPPGRPAKPDSLRRGLKYELVRLAFTKLDIDEEPIGWIVARRALDFQRDDGIQGPAAFRVIAEDISKLMDRAGQRDYVTQETVRAWYRAEMERRDLEAALQAAEPKPVRKPRKRAQ